MCCVLLKHFGALLWEKDDIITPLKTSWVQLPDHTGLKERSEGRILPDEMWLAGELGKIRCEGDRAFTGHPCAAVITMRYIQFMTTGVILLYIMTDYIYIEHKQHWFCTVRLGCTTPSLPVSPKSTVLITESFNFFPRISNTTPTFPFFISLWEDDVICQSMQLRCF